MKSGGKKKKRKRGRGKRPPCPLFSTRHGWLHFGNNQEKEEEKKKGRSGHYGALRRTSAWIAAMVDPIDGLERCSGRNIELQAPISVRLAAAQSPHSHSTVTAQSQHSHSTVTDQHRITSTNQHPPIASTHSNHPSDRKHRSASNHKHQSAFDKHGSMSHGVCALRAGGGQMDRRDARNSSQTIKR